VPNAAGACRIATIETSDKTLIVFIAISSLLG
jgi:hypothetical protein